MPSTTERQRKFMGAELGRLRAGKGTKTGMRENQLRDYARKTTKRKKRGRRASKGRCVSRRSR